jgi:hypothetical protein
MIDTLATLQPIQATLPPVVEEHDMATTSDVTYPEGVTTGVNYYVQGKYQNNLPKLYACFVLC